MRHINKNYAARDNHECDKDSHSNFPIFSQMSKRNHYDMEITFIRHSGQMHSHRSLSLFFAFVTLNF